MSYFFSECIYLSSHKFGSRVALDDKTISITYFELDKITTNAADIIYSQLKDKTDLGKKRIVFFFERNITSFIALLTLLKLGVHFDIVENVNDYKGDDDYIVATSKAFNNFADLKYRKLLLFSYVNTLESMPNVTLILIKSCLDKIDYSIPAKLSKYSWNNLKEEELLIKFNKPDSFLSYKDFEEQYRQLLGKNYIKEASGNLLFPMQCSQFCLINLLFLFLKIGITVSFVSPIDEKIFEKIDVFIGEEDYIKNLLQDIKKKVEKYPQYKLFFLDFLLSFAYKKYLLKKGKFSLQNKNSYIGFYNYIGLLDFHIFNGVLVYIREKYIGKIKHIVTPFYNTFTQEDRVLLFSLLDDKDKMLEME